MDTKLDEELAEYHKHQNIEELADLLELIRACAAARGCSLDQLEQVQAKKAAKSGRLFEMGGRTDPEFSGRAER